MKFRRNTNIVIMREYSYFYRTMNIHIFQAILPFITYLLKLVNKWLRLFCLFSKHFPVLYFVVQVSYNDIKQKRNKIKVRSMNILDQNPLTSDFWGSQSQHPIWDIARINGNKK